MQKLPSLALRCTQRHLEYISISRRSVIAVVSVVCPSRCFCVLIWAIWEIASSELELGSQRYDSRDRLGRVYSLPQLPACIKVKVCICTYTVIRLCRCQRNFLMSGFSIDILRTINFNDNGNSSAASHFQRLLESFENPRYFSLNYGDVHTYIFRHSWKALKIPDALVELWRCPYTRGRGFESGPHRFVHLCIVWRSMRKLWEFALWNLLWINC